jgi:subtilase family serine protease
VFPFVAAAALLAGCGILRQAQDDMPQAQDDTGGIPQVLAAAAHAAVPACGGSRIGRAQCDVLIETGVRRNNISGWTAKELEAAYNLPSSTKGKGQAVYIVDAYDNPDVATDFAEYRSAMRLPKGVLNKYNQDGQQSNYPSGSPDWGVEIDLDVEMASASCPKCTIDLLEANSSNWSDIETAEAEAVTLGATIISNSYDGTGASESYYDTPGVTYVASAGDSPGSGDSLYDPATFDDVAAVGGTVLTIAKNKRGYDEMTWSDSGGGCSSTGEQKPPWQHDKYSKTCKYRVGNDVSAVAAEVAEYDTYDNGGWITVDGTSIGSPFIAGVFGLAGNSTKQHGGKTFWVPKSHHKYLYKVGGKRFSYVGGWGSPDGTGAF